MQAFPLPFFIVIFSFFTAIGVSEMQPRGDDYTRGFQLLELVLRRPVSCHIDILLLSSRTELKHRSVLAASFKKWRCGARLYVKGYYYIPIVWITINLQGC